MWMRAGVLALLSMTACKDDYLIPTGGGDDPGRVDTIVALTGDASAGADLFDSKCSGCHDAAGQEDRVGPALAEPVANDAASAIIDVIINGEGSMPAQNLEDQEVADVYAWMKASFGGGADTDVAPTDTDLATGDELFDAKCKVCHNADGSSGPVGPSLSAIVPNRTAEQLTTTVADGVPPAMPGFSSSMSAAEIQILVDWLVVTFGS